MTAAQARALGRLIRKARIQRNVSSRQLAATLHVAVGWLHGVEAGRFLSPSADRLVLLAEELRIEPRWIDRLTDDSIRKSLPGMYTYLRGKYDLSAEDVEKVKRYVKRLREDEM
jgi:transcriptional regulator with XRE-family HTH domain